MKKIKKVVLIIWVVVMLTSTIFLGVMDTKDMTYTGTDISIEIEQFFRNITIEAVNPTRITVSGISSDYFNLEGKNQILSSTIENPVFKTRNEVRFVLNQEIYSGTWKTTGYPKLEFRADKEIKVISKMKTWDKIGNWVTVLCFNLIIYFIVVPFIFHIFRFIYKKINQTYKHFF